MGALVDAVVAQPPASPFPQDQSLQLQHLLALSPLCNHSLSRTETSQNLSAERTMPKWRRQMRGSRPMPVQQRPSCKKSSLLIRR